MPIDKIKFSDTVGKFLEKGYRPGAFGPDAYDCISFIYCFYRDLGYDPPDSIDGYNADNYLALYERDPAAAKKTMLRYLRSLGEKVDTYPQLGDILLLHQEDGTFAAAIVIGRGVYMGVHTPYGVIVLPRRSILKETIIEVIRPCPRHSL